MKKLFVFTVAILLNLPVFSGTTQTQTLKDLQRTAKPKKAKMAPDLEELLTQDDEARYAGMTLAELRQQRLQRMKGKRADASGEEPLRHKIGGAVLPSEAVGEDEKQSFIVQLENTASEVVWREKVARLGGRIQQKHSDLGLVTIEAPRAAIRQLAADSNIAYVSPDRAVAAMGHVETTTGAAQIRNLVKGMTLTGTGIGLAVIDSGMYTSHKLLANSSSHTGVIYSRDFTGQNEIQDPFGHGSVVASMAAGDNGLENGTYTGIATDTKIINLRVLDELGRGIASNVIAALDWCVTNQAKYNIRVINLSLGTMAKDSYVNDPLCRAARRAVNAGIVVVASAGNNGKDANGNKIYGTINSPGIDPSVLTVGAVNTLGTDVRSDDVVTSYSSRGPTRGYTTDVNGVRHYDNLLKPDLVAPGNRLIGASASLGRKKNQLASTSPSLVMKGGRGSTNDVMYLSGTSVAAPVVAGTAALLLQANPALTPNLVKAILMYTAQPLPGFNLFEQGAGELNVDGAVRVAKLVKTTLPTTVGAALLTAALPAQQSTIAGQTCNWGQGVITNWGFLYGSNLMTNWQNVYGNGVALADATGMVNGALSLVAGQTSSGVAFYPGVANIKSSGVALADGIMMAEGIALADGIMMAEGIALADGIMMAEGIALADGIMMADGIALADGIMMADGTINASAAYLGDNTACMPPAP